METPIDSNKESHLVLVDLVRVQPADLTPGASRVVSILQVLRSQDEGRQEHATTALQSSDGITILRLFHGEIMFGDMWLNQDQVIQCNLQS